MLFNCDLEEEIVGMEAMAFKRYSKLSEDLISVFSDAIAYRDSLRAQNLPGREIVNKVASYAENQMQLGFKKAVKNNTNLIIKKINVTKMSINFGRFAVDITMDSSDEDFVKALYTVTGKIRFDPSKSPALLDIMEAGSNSDVFSGVIKKNSFGIEGSKNIAVDMFFDVGCMCVKEMYTTKAPDLNAGELAAIMTHEIGHVITILEEMAKFTCAKELIARNFEFDMTTKKDLTLKEVKNKVNEIKKFTDQAEKKINDPKFKSSMKSDEMILLVILITLIKNLSVIIIEFILDDVEDVNLDDNKIFAVGSYIFNMLVALFNLSFISLQSLYVSIIQAWVMRYVTNTINYGINASETSEKALNDRLRTIRDEYEMERRADEFVVRNGLGSHIISGLEKIYAIMGYAQLGKVNSASVRESKLLFGIVNLYTYIVRATYSDPIFNLPYESSVKRNLRIQENIRGAFKALDMPKDMFDHYEDELKRASRLCEASQKGFFAKFGVLLQFINKIADPGRVVSSIFTGNVIQDYEKLLDNIDTLTNTKLYYQSHKLANLKR